MAALYCATLLLLLLVAGAKIGGGGRHCKTEEQEEGIGMDRVKMKPCREPGIKKKRKRARNIKK